MKFRAVLAIFTVSAVAYTPCGASVNKPPNVRCCRPPLDGTGTSAVCQAPKRKPSSADDFKQICGNERPQCCKGKLVGLINTGCAMPAGEEQPPPPPPSDYNPCPSPANDTPRCCDYNAVLDHKTCDKQAPNPPPKDLASFKAQCKADEDKIAFCCPKPSSGDTQSCKRAR